MVMNSQGVDVPHIKKEERDMETRKSVDKIEREVVRITMIAQNDKRASMSSTCTIERCKQELLQICEDFYTPGHPQRESIEKAISEVDLPLEAIIELEQSRRPMSQAKTRAFASPIDNIINSVQSQPRTGSPNQAFQAFQDKLDELRRVQVRAKQESLRNSFMAQKAEELKTMNDRESKHWREAATVLAVEIQRKEKEIERVQISAERDKRACLQLDKQIISLRRSVEGIKEARPSDDVDTMLRRSESSTRAPTPVTCDHVPSENPVFGIIRGDKALTPLRQDVDRLLRQEAQKDLELARVRSIAKFEEVNVHVLEQKAEEMKEFVVSEIQSTDHELTRKVSEIRTKQKAIEKVTARCDKDRARSLFILGEMLRLSNELPGEHTNLGADMAYMQEFREVGDTRQFAKGTDLTSSPTQLPSIPSTEFVDPMKFVKTPPFREISFGTGNSKSIFVQKLRELETLDREQLKRDEELLRLKRVAEAERYRTLLWQERFQELRDEVEYQQNQPMSRTY